MSDKVILVVAFDANNSIMGAFATRQLAVKFASTEPEKFVNDESLPVRAEVRADEELGLMVVRYYVPRKGTYKGQEKNVWWFIKEMPIQGGISHQQILEERDQKWVAYSGMPAPDSVQPADPKAKLVMARGAESLAGKNLLERQLAVVQTEVEAAKANLPVGHRLEWVHSVYNGSHSERGYQDGCVILAVPAKLDIDIRKVAGISHLSGNDHCRAKGWELLQDKNVLEWDGDQWSPIDVDSQPNVITEEGYEFNKVWLYVMGETIYAV